LSIQSAVNAASRDCDVNKAKFKTPCINNKTYNIESGNKIFIFLILKSYESEFQSLKKSNAVSELVINSCVHDIHW